jgi:hypothetical protein
MDVISRGTDINQQSVQHPHGCWLCWQVCYDLVLAAAMWVFGQSGVEKARMGQR